MATPEATARGILAYFKRSDVEAGEILMSGAVNLDAINRNVSPDEYVEGLKYAIQRGWLQDEGAILRLTKSGYAEF